MEIRGVLYKAGLEQSKAGDKQIFKIGVRPTGGKDWDLTLFDSNIIATCEKLRGKQVAVIAEKPEGTKYWNVLGVKEATGEPKPEAQIHESIDKKETDWDKIGRQKARCSLFESACHLLAGVHGNTGDDVAIITNLGEQAVIIAQIGEAYVFGEAKQPESKPGAKQGEMIVEYVSEQMIKNLMRYSKAEDEEDLRVKAEAFLGSKLPGIGALKNADAQRWALELNKAKK